MARCVDATRSSGSIRTSYGARTALKRKFRALRERLFSACPEPPLTALRSLIAESRIDLPEELPPMAAGIFGYLGYDMVRLMEELTATQPRSDRHP